MGKKIFKKLYKRIKNELDKNYAGMIVYAINGKFEWKNKKGKTKGYKGKSFYIVVQCTDDWPSKAFRDAGRGRVHNHLLEYTLGYDHEDGIVCCGGFAYHDGKLKFSSIWLNQTSQKGCESDDSNELSGHEKMLVKYCFKQYKKFGTDHRFNLPYYIDTPLSN
ncbi:5285_t:CDS:2 [Scutellospora calospora]|uniref:5285_t:CDS:1 n=1 Tax=Scutellospora calospora TaxID=85575 RepID=A0ACA9KPM7_9GLOM|nr:5285_t:CDS:2 [Scutellospora calospora]